jgi:hypothetical protein
MRPDWKECPKDDLMPQYAGIHVSMNPKGTIALSKATYKHMGEPKAFLLLFDTVNNRIGLKPTGLGIKNAYPVRAATKQGGKKVRA